MEILIGKASNRRSKSSTNSNSVSSRSHGVFILHLEGENPLEKMSSRGSLSLVDLAGSENIDKSGSVGDQMTEAQSINKSLFYLRYVIQQIKDKSNHVNYRDSVLTSLLKYSLGKVLLYSIDLIDFSSINPFYIHIYIFIHLLRRYRKSVYAS